MSDFLPQATPILLRDSTLKKTKLCIIFCLKLLCDINGFNYGT